MEIRNRETGEVVDERTFIAMHANSSLPDGRLTPSFLEEKGADVVLEAPAPTVTQYQTAYRNGVVQDTLGNWVYAWTIRDWTQEEIDVFNAAQDTALQAGIVQATQARLDSFAQTRNYDGILSACTYANSTVPKFQTEGIYCVQARDSTWDKLYSILADVNAGNWPTVGANQKPTGFADIEPSLPVLSWPN